jgi:hypothetical protein
MSKVNNLTGVTMIHILGAATLLQEVGPAGDMPWQPRQLPAR